MDAIEQLVSAATLSAAVLGKSNGDVHLVYLGDPDTAASAVKDPGLHGYGFCGVVGLVDGRITLEYEPGCHLVALLGVFEFAQRLMSTPAPQDDSVQWLRKLYALPDERRI